MVLVCDKVDTEPVLLLPPQLTKSTYATLLALDFVPRKWHVEGRYGSRTHKVEEKNEGKPSRNKIGIPLLPSLKNIRFIESILKTRDDGCDEETNSNYVDTYGLASSKDLRDLHASLLTPGVQLVHKPPVASNKIPKVEIFDATVHPELMPPNFPSQLRNFLQSVGIQSDENGHHEKPQKRQKYTNLTPKDYAHSKKITTCSSSSPAFTFCELFAGIGGFGVALEALGGSCVFASEIYEPSKRVYRNNLDLTNLPNQEIAGDIWDIDSKDIPYHDLLVGGFPCQPFSSLGDQPGLKDPKIVSGRKHGIDKQSSSCFTNDDVFTEDGSEREHHAECNGRGQLFTQIVRVLRDLQPKGFLLENVPGLLTTDNGFALRTILSSLESVGYHVSYEVCSSRGLTAQSRKRLYIVGIKKNISYADDKEEGRALESSSPFQFPFMPDLHFRAGDVLHRAEELEQPNDDTGIPADLFRRLDSQVKASEQSGITDRSLSSSHLNLGSLLQLTHQQMDQLRHRSKSWKPAKLAWDDTTCDTIDSHYGVSVGKVSYVEESGGVGSYRFRDTSTS